MATTTGTTTPMAPQGGWGGAAAVQSLQFPAADGAIAKGDVIIIETGPTGKVDENNAAGIDVILGVAMEGVTAEDDLVSVALAIPGQFFEANMVNNVTDYTGVIATALFIAYGVVESADGYACVDIADTTNKVAVAYKWAKQQNTTQDPDPVSGGVGVTNPRVVFSFINSVFNQESA